MDYFTANVSQQNIGSFISAIIISLTDEGMLLRKRAEDIIEMTDKTVAEFSSLDEINGGDIYISCAESYLIKMFGIFMMKLPLLFAVFFRCA